MFAKGNETMFHLCLHMFSCVRGVFCRALEIAMQSEARAHVSERITFSDGGSTTQVSLVEWSVVITWPLI